MQVLKTARFVVQRKYQRLWPGKHYNHEPTRTRKLLLNKNEIRKLIGKSKGEGLTLIPWGYILKTEGKIELRLAKGKNTYEKRESITKRIYTGFRNENSRKKY